jgi:hypothetical protein
LKCKSFKTVTVAIGTQGVGFVCVAPTIVNDKFAISYSDATYALDYFNVTDATTGVVNAKFNTLPVTYADIVTNNVAQGRVVVAGIRPRYTGSPLYQTGSMYIIGDSNRQLLAGLTAADVSEQSVTRVKGVNRNPHTLVQTNNNATERQYSDENYGNIPLQVYPYGSGAGTVDTAPPATMGILFVGATSSVGQTFQVDIMLRAEYTGLKAAPSATPSHDDSEGYSMIRDAYDQMATAKKSATESDSALFNQLLRRARKSIKKVSPLLMDFAREASAAFLPPAVTRSMQAVGYL